VATWTVRKSSFYALFIVLLFTAEFYYIELGGGVARLYHFMAVWITLVLAIAIPKLFMSNIFLCLLIFFAVNIFSAALSDSSVEAFASLTSFMANIAITMAVAMLLLTNKISIERFTNLLLLVTAVSVIWSLIQILAFRFGLVLGLSEHQEAQILMGFGPAFRTEANTFGKYLSFAFLFFLPLLIRSPRDRRLRFFYILLLVGILSSFTRTAIVGALAGGLFAFFWYSLRGKFSMVSTRILSIVLAVTIMLGLVSGGLVRISDYAQHKLDTLFLQDEWTAGSSSAYRLEAMQAVIDSALRDDRKLVIGNGWGQTYVYVRGLKVQAGGADVVNILGYAGLIGVTFYLLYTLVLLVTLSRVARNRRDPDLAAFAEGLLFAAVGMFVTGHMSGYLIAPEYYLLLGASIYTGIASKRLRPVLLR
jgi:hypothetical protein